MAPLIPLWDSGIRLRAQPPGVHPAGPRSAPL